MSQFFTPKLVWTIVLVCIGIIVLLNALLNLNTVKNDTVNNRLSFWANGKYFFITFLWGVLGGHFFMGTVKPLFCCNWWLPVLLLIIICVVLILLKNKIKPKPYLQAFLLIFGLLYGHIIWSQRHEATIFQDGECLNTNIFCSNE